MTTHMSPRLARWRAAWQSLEAQRISALYADDATHESAAVARALPNHGTRLTGRAQIDEFVTAACARLRAFRIEPFHATEIGDISVIEYHRVVNDDEAGVLNVCEVIAWRGDQVVASCVYHA